MLNRINWQSLSYERLLKGLDRLESAWEDYLSYFYDVEVEFIDDGYSRTECILTVPNGNKFRGVAKVHPSDRFIKHIGMKLSLERANEKMKKYLQIKEIEYESEKIRILKLLIGRCERRITEVSQGVRLEYNPNTDRLPF